MREDEHLLVALRPRMSSAGKCLFQDVDQFLAGLSVVLLLSLLGVPNTSWMPIPYRTYSGSIFPPSLRLLFHSAGDAFCAKPPGVGRVEAAAALPTPAETETAPHARTDGRMEEMGICV